MPSSLTSSFDPSEPVLQPVLQRMVTHVVQGIVAGHYPAYTADHLRTLGGSVAAHWQTPLWRLHAEERAPAWQGLHLALAQMLHAHLVPIDGLWPEAMLALASGCFGRQHLWQDLGLDGREQVSLVLRRGFPGLHASNVRDLKWKRHLFLELGALRGEHDLRPPKCDGCDQFSQCFPT